MRGVDELRCDGLVDLAIQPDRALARRAHIAGPVGSVAERQRDQHRRALYAGADRRHMWRAGATPDVMNLGGQREVAPPGQRGDNWVEYFRHRPHHQPDEQRRSQGDDRGVDGASMWLCRTAHHGLQFACVLPCAIKDEAAFRYVTLRLSGIKELGAQRFQRGFIHVDVHGGNAAVV